MDFKIPKDLYGDNFSIEQADEGFMALLDAYNRTCERYADGDDVDLGDIAFDENALYAYGAWEDSEGLWRSPMRKVQS
jgi:hypothetical protein